MSRFQRGAINFTKPENALKRAEELIVVGQKVSALQTLHDVITSKRHRTWQKVLEQIMFKYVDLCVDLKKGRYAKDGLIHYRNVCQQVNVSSLEEVIKYFLKTATDRAEEAQAKAEAVTIDVEDLEVDATPEDLMLSYVSGEKGKDRTDRELVTPWFKFLWETYRTVLDILRNNSRLEALYAMTATKAFQFCLTYKRTTEFRRLCDILRNHLQNLNKYRDQRDRPDLTNPESLQLYQESRFEQLKVACELELWQEAFRSVEDIQGLIAMGKKSPKPQMMATYYAKLTRIFTVSQSHLYNGYAWYKLFNLAKGYNKNLTQSDLQMMACSVLLAALSILPYDQIDRRRTEAEAEQDKDRSVRMATILGFSVDAKRDARNILSRTALVSELASKGVLNIVPDEIKQIHALLESDFTPLELCQRLGPLLDSLDGLSKPMSGASPVQDAGLGQYKKSLQQVAVVRLLQQLGQVYSVMKVSALAALVPFLSFAEVEALIVDAVKYDYLQVRIDHRNGTVHFGGQRLESDKIRDHIATLAKRFSKALTLIYPRPHREKELKKIKAIEDAVAVSARDNKRAIARKAIIEKKKEEQELALQQAEKEEDLKRQQQARLNEAAEDARRKAERLKREEERLQKELEERERQEAMAMLEQAKLKGKGVKVREGEKLDKNALMKDVLTEQQKQREEAERKIQKAIRQMDHFERARREDEAPMLLEAYQKKLKTDEVDFAEAQKAAAAAHAKQWEIDVAEKRRLVKMLTHKEQIQGQIHERRKEEFEALQHEREERIAERKAMRRAERDLRRKEEYVRRCRLDIEERRLKAEEEEMRIEEEKRLAEEAERQRKLDEAAARQAARLKEMEERAAAEKAALLAAGPRAAAPAAAAPSGGSGYLPPSRRTGAFVPPSRRAQDGAPAAAAAAPAAAAREEPAEDGAGWRRAAPAARDAPPAQEERKPGGWVPPARRAAAGAADVPPPAAGRTEGWSRSAPRTEEAPARGDTWSASRGHRDDGPPGRGPGREDARDAGRGGARPDRWAPTSGPAAPAREKPRW
ncbi:hypothetical protein WJX72_011465 [[Myrmecia] bisecta]|uniref:Eukaryotic translation initiation factor 3 subunit A n=1 Tax=[Myrmecia] bisecta TaxID=41462 RepID=A0AAW1QSV9_9CHLO